MEKTEDEKSYSAYISMATLEKFVAEDEKVTRSENNRTRNKDQQQNKYDNIKVKCESIDIVKQVADTIKGMGYQAFSLNDILESMQDTSRTLQLILGGIGAVSLLVAAIGITNTMIMSIYERTKEIGIIKVIGADIRDIKKMFLFEAAMIGFFGGIFGLLLSYGLSWGLNNLSTSGIFGIMNNGTVGISVIPLYLALGALLFATLVGIISGYSPARRAMKLSVLDAIRTE